MQTAGHCEECAHKTAGIERALLNRSKQFGTLAEIIVMAFSRKFVVASYGCFKGFYRNAHLLSKFIKCIGNDNLTVLDVLRLESLFNFNVPAVAPRLPHLSVEKTAGEVAVNLFLHVLCPVGVVDRPCNSVRLKFFRARLGLGVDVFVHKTFAVGVHMQETVAAGAGL